MPRLVIRKGEGAGKDHALSAVCIVGRHASANFVLGDTLVSRNHFRVVPEGGRWFVEDMGSTNGTLVNGRRVTRLPLSDGDVIVVGGTELQFVQKDMLAAGGGRPAVAPAVPAARAVLPALPATARPAAAPAIRPAVPAAPATQATPAPRAGPTAGSGLQAPPGPPKPPPVQAPIPSKRRR